MLDTLREAVIARLVDAFAEQELDGPEYERRVSLAVSAEREGALLLLVRDLPSPVEAVETPRQAREPFPCPWWFLAAVVAFLYSLASWAHYVLTH